MIYSGATVLGRITIGKGAVIGGGCWVTRTCPGQFRDAGPHAGRGLHRRCGYLTGNRPVRHGGVGGRMLAFGRLPRWNPNRILTRCRLSRLTARGRRTAEC